MSSKGYYIVRFVVCEKCGSYMLLSHTYVTSHGITVIYTCNCGFSLSLVSRIRNKKDE